MTIKNNKKIMITGAAGFIGSHLSERLISEGNIVYAFDIKPLNECKNLENLQNNPNFNYFQGDIRDEESVSSFFQKDAKVIYHLASIVGVRYYMEDPLSLIDITINGTKNIIKLCIDFDTKLLFASTSEIYGKNPNTPWNEEADRVLGSPGVDRWCYSSSKALIEHMLFGLHRNGKLNFSTVRFFNVYGPKQNPIYVVSQSIYRILRNESPDIYDGGKQTRCFTYIDDAIDGLILAATEEIANGHVFNIGNQNPTNIEDIVNYCINESGIDIKINNINTQEMYGIVYQDIINRIPDSSKAQKLLNWTANTNPKEGIKKTIEWVRKNNWYLNS
jgi:UDP-glucose 4-epimerase